MPLKVTLHYEEGPSDRHLQLAMKLPKKWRSGPVRQVTDFFVESYNNKFPEYKLDAKDVHAESSGGRKVCADDVAEEAFTHKEHLYIKPGAPPKNQKKRSQEEDNDPSLLTCRNFGCQQRFRAADNGPRVCTHHRKGPVFWNGYKYWGCCEGRKVNDWEQFMRIPGCVCGPHSTEAPKGVDLVSPTVLAARQAAMEEKERKSTAHLKDISSYTKQSLEAKALAPRPKPKPKEALPAGCARCVHTECKKIYSVSENNAKACRYHRGRAVFHDGAKWWSCCSAQRKSYDWDDFMKVKKCAVGFHWDGKGQDPNPQPEVQQDDGL